jgi:NAD(P)-dependent dehydrogenase (short-subunit alcohol dehydrogenase family)
MAPQQRVAVVTGASTGIGRGIAKRLAKEGIDVVNADLRRDPEQGDHYQTDLTTPTDELLEKQFGVRAKWIKTDISDRSAVRNLIEETIGEFGQLDHVVNNAGILIPGSSQEITVEDWDTVIDVNLRGQFMLSKFAIPHLKESDCGRIVNISSVNARFGGAGPPYATSKAGIVNLTRDLAEEVAEYNITANCILPGVVKTPMQDLNDKETMERQATKTPLPRLGTPGDIGNAVAFLVSDDAEWITGADIPVDGGYLAGDY